MTIHFWSIGKHHETYVAEGVGDFTNRINKYFTVSWKLIPPVKNSSSLSEQELKRKEADVVLSILSPADYLVALDERGKEFTSEQLASFLQQRTNESVKQLVFVIGGAYGLDARILNRANMQWSLSKLTFPHQLVRLILTEQVYRACTILRNEKYHHA